MALDANKPTDQDLVSEHAEYIRETREAVNNLATGTQKAATNLTIPAGTTSLTVGTSGGLDDDDIESVIVTGTGVSTLTAIYGGLDGQLKIFIFQDGNVSLKDGGKLGGQFYLNQLPAGSNFNAAQDDVIALLNVGGDGTSHGYWKELYRTVSVK